MTKYFSVLLVFLVLIVTTSFIITRNKEYIISITFPETKSLILKDTMQKFLDIDARDCGWTTMIIKYTNEYNFNEYETNNCFVGDSFLYSDVLLTKKNLTTVDTINKSSYRYGCGLKKEFINSLKGDYFLKVIPKNKLFKAFDTVINIDSKAILEKGRYINVRLGNYAKTYTYKISSKKKVTNHEKKIIKKFLWEHGIRGFCLNYTVDIDIWDGFVIYGKTIHIEQQQ